MKLGSVIDAPPVGCGPVSVVSMVKPLARRVTFVLSVRTRQFSHTHTHVQLQASNCNSPIHNECRRIVRVGRRLREDEAHRVGCGAVSVGTLVRGPQFRSLACSTNNVNTHLVEGLNGLTGLERSGDGGGRSRSARLQQHVALK